MGKKRTRKMLKSKGIHGSVNHSVATAVRAEQKKSNGLNNLVSCWRDLKNPWVTIQNPNKEQTNRRFIKVRANDYFGNPKFVKE